MFLGRAASSGPLVRLLLGAKKIKQATSKQAGLLFNTQQHAHSDSV